MDLAPKLIQKIKSSLLIGASAKEEVLEKWKTFSEARQKALLEMFDLSAQMEGALFRQNAEQNPFFAENLGSFIKASKTLGNLENH